MSEKPERVWLDFEEGMGVKSAIPTAFVLCGLARATKDDHLYISADPLRALLKTLRAASQLQDDESVAGGIDFAADELEKLLKPGISRDVAESDWRRSALKKMDARYRGGE